MPLAKARQPGWVRLAGLSRASPRVSGSMREFWGSGQTARQSRVCLQSRLRPGGAAAAGGSAGAGRGPSGSRCRACSCYTPALEPLPGTSFAFPTSGRPSLPPSPGETQRVSLASPSREPSSCPQRFPRQPQPWQIPPSLQEPLQKRNPVACQRRQWLLRHTAGPRASGGVRSPMSSPPAVACVSSCVESPAPAVTSLLAFSSRRG